MWSVKSSDIIDRLVISGHENLQTYHHWQPKWMTTDKLICAVESGKYEAATFVNGEEYIIESTFFAKLSIQVWFNVATLLEEFLYLHALLFPIEFLDLAGLGGVKGCWSDTGYIYVVFRTKGRCIFDCKDGRQIVRRLSGGSLRH